MNPIFEKCEALFAEGYSVSSVSIEPREGELFVSISINTFVPLGEGGDLPNHTVSVDYKNCPKSVSIGGFERMPNEEMHLRGNDEQAEALIRDLAATGLAHDVAKVGAVWSTRPNKWFLLEGRRFDRRARKFFEDGKNEM